MTKPMIDAAMKRLKAETTEKVYDKALEEVSGDRGPCEVEPIVAHGFGFVWVDRGRGSEFRRLWNAEPGQTPDLLKRLERCRAELDQSRTELRKSEAEWNTCFAELVKTRAECDRARDTLNVIEMTLRIGK